MKLRYEIEQNIFMNLFTKDPVKVISKLLTEKEKYIYNLFKKIYEEKNESFDYKQYEFSVENDSIDQLEFIVINLPYKEIEVGNCYKIILAYSFNLSLYQYLMIEEAKDNEKDHYKALSSWIEGNHFIYCDIKEEELKNITKKIYDALMVN